jgi:hypothetical protein
MYSSSMDLSLYKFGVLYVRNVASLEILPHAPALMYVWYHMAASGDWVSPGSALMCYQLDSIYEDTVPDV